MTTRKWRLVAEPDDDVLAAVRWATSNRRALQAQPCGRKLAVLASYIAKLGRDR